MDFYVDLSAIAWRDVIMVASAAATTYLLVALSRLWSSRRARARLRRAHVGPDVGADAAPAAGAQAEAKPEAAAAPTAEADADPDLAAIRHANHPLEPYPGIAADAQSEFNESAYLSELEAQLAELREEVAAQLGELRRELAELKASRRVSPQYSEAMLLAQRGMDVQRIADECGISLGEAELVLSLSRNRRQYEERDGLEGAG